MPTNLPVAICTQGSWRVFGLSCAAIAVVAIGLAVFIGSFCNDAIGSMLMLLMVSGLLGFLLRSARVATTGTKSANCEASVVRSTK